MIKKYLILIIVLIITVVVACAMIFGEIYAIVGLSSIGGVLLGFLLPDLIRKIQDCMDISEWQVSLRKLRRGKLLNKDSSVRISFAYLYRIMIDGKYLLVKNARGTQKFQPVGGAYKYNKEEKLFLSKNFDISFDNKIPIDQSSREDYRLYVCASKLKKFVKHFDKTNNRETVANLGREFSEELVKTGIVNFSHIEYRYCGRHFTEVQYSRVFNCYELLLADIVEFIPSKEQEDALRKIMKIPSDNYLFVGEEEINTCGVTANTNRLVETIADHTIKILQKNQIKLEKNKKLQKVYSIEL